MIFYDRTGPAAGEVRVKLAISSINPTDVKPRDRWIYGIGAAEPLPLR